MMMHHLNTKQIIGFTIKPLWDPEIPLEYFLSSVSANRFRNYISNATETMMNYTANCLNDQGQNCTASGGTCVPNLANVRE